MTPAELASLAAPLVALLLPGWRITWEVYESPEDLGGALAMIYPIPERSMATIKVAQHPPGESVLETIAHELTHAVLSPLTSQIPASGASVMLEEQTVERLSLALAQVPTGQARAMARAMARYAPRVRSKISALAGRAGKGRSMMTAEQAQKALDALESGDAEATKAILKEMIATMVAGAAGGDVADAKPDAVADDQTAAAGGPKGAYRGDDAPPGAPPAMRQAARAAAESAARMRRAETSAQGSAIRLRIHEARTVDGFAITSEMERKILAAGTIERAEELLEFARLARAEAPAAQRARSGAKPESAKPDADAADDKEPEELKSFPADFQAEFRRLRKSDKAAAEYWLSQGKARKARDDARGKN